MTHNAPKRPCIWFPTTTAGSGSDVYVRRLVAGLTRRGIEANIHWAPSSYELAPWLFSKSSPPAGANIIHASTWNAFAFSHTGLPIVATAFHCVYRCGYPEWKTAAQALYHNLWIGRFEKRSLRRATAAVAMTSSALGDFKARFEMPHTVVIPGWVDVEKFTPTNSECASNVHTNILIVGNQLKRKGMDLLPQLRCTLSSNYKITVIGGLRGKQFSSIDGITFKYHLSNDELVTEYQCADIVVSLSRYEGFGYSALEAMACGKPVVAFDVTGIRDVVRHAITGFLVPQDNVTEMAKMCELLRNNESLRLTMGARGREQAIKFFNEKDAIDRYLDLYSSMLLKR